MFLEISSLILFSIVGDTEISVHIENVRNDRGSILCSLFNQPDGFPDISQKAIVNVQEEPKKGLVECRFKNLSPDFYSVSVLHDENDNGLMDYNFLGIPLEGYGASLNELPRFSKQKFEPNKFELKKNETKLLKVELRYW